MTTGAQRLANSVQIHGIFAVRALGTTPFMRDGRCALMASLLERLSNPMRPFD